MRNDLSQEAVASFVREAREQAERFRRMAAESRKRLLDIECWLMEQRCIREHRLAMARIEARERDKNPATCCSMSAAGYNLLGQRASS